MQNIKLSWQVVLGKAGFGTLAMAILFALAQILSGAPASAETSDADSAPPLALKVQKLVAQLSEGKFPEACSQFDESLASRLSAESLAALWKQVAGGFGKINDSIRVRVESKDPLAQKWLALCDFEKGTLEVRVVFNASDKVIGLWLNPKWKYVSPEYVDAAKYLNEPVIIGSAPWTLHGTLTLPASGSGAFPALVLVHGSGPSDQDESVGAQKPFKDIAEYLPSEGIAVLRYTKRTREYGLKMKDMTSLTVKEEVVDDALAAVEFLRKDRRIDPKRIFLLGHSLGAKLAPRISKQAPGLGGLILMAGPTKREDDIILDQYQYLFNVDGTISPEEEKELDAMKEKVARLRDPALLASSTMDQLPFQIPAGYWQDLFAYDPVKTALEISTPLLILQGERDYQVTAQDYDGWKKGLKDRQQTAFMNYPSLNHLFSEGIGKSVPDDYLVPNHVALQVLSDIVAFIRNQK